MMNSTDKKGLATFTELDKVRGVTLGGKGLKACQDGLEHFVPTFALGCKGLPG